MSIRNSTVAAMAAALIGGAAAAQAATPPLRLCADPTNPPFSSDAADAKRNGSPGLYVEIGEAVAAALGRPLETVWSLSYFGKRNLRTTLLAGRCDLAVGLPAESDFMGPRVIFSRPILQVGYALVVPKGQRVTRLDDLRGRRVAVQFGSPPQGVLAARTDVTSVTTREPEEAMRRLAAGEVDAAFIWGPSAGYINRTQLADAYDVIAVDAPQMRWSAAIGFSSKQPGLRDEVDGVLEQLAPRISELAAKYAVVAAGPAITLSDDGAMAAQAPVAAPAKAAQRMLVAAGPAITLSDAGPVAAQASVAAPSDAAKLQEDVEEGRKIFNGTCSHCHGPDAVQSERKINLRLLKHRYGDKMAETYNVTVAKGRPAKGMPAWEGVFKEQDLAKILAYLNTVQEQ
jgi:ABC-type amino acid transport substrate-binding protein/cytochrome c553